MGGHVFVHMCTLWAVCVCVCVWQGRRGGGGGRGCIFRVIFSVHMHIYLC